MDRVARRDIGGRQRNSREPSRWGCPRREHDRNCTGRDGQAGSKAVIGITDNIALAIQSSGDRVGIARGQVLIQVDDAVRSPGPDERMANRTVHVGSPNPAFTDLLGRRQGRNLRVCVSGWMQIDDAGCIAGPKQGVLMRGAQGKVTPTALLRAGGAGRLRGVEAEGV